MVGRLASEFSCHPRNDQQLQQSIQILVASKVFLLDSPQHSLLRYKCCDYLEKI